MGCIRTPLTNQSPPWMRRRPKSQRPFVRSPNYSPPVLGGGDERGMGITMAIKLKVHERCTQCVQIAARREGDRIKGWHDCPNAHRGLRIGQHERMETD